MLGGGSDDTPEKLDSFGQPVDETTYQVKSGYQEFTEQTEEWEKEDAIMGVSTIIGSFVGQVLESQNEPSSEGMGLLLNELGPFIVADKLKLARVLKDIGELILRESAIVHLRDLHGNLFEYNGSLGKEE